MNKVILVGNLTRDPEGGQTAGGVTWCRFTLAINRRFTDQEGKRQADFLTVVAWRTLAENCIRYLAKGRKAAVVGRLETRSYDGEDGVKRYVTEVIADEVEFLTARGGQAADDESGE